MAPEVIKIGLGQKTAEEVGESIRKQFVNAMRNGERLCLDIDKTKPVWSSYNKEGTFDADVFFNHEALSQENVYMQYVREDENHGIGGVNPGFGYVRADAFCGIVRSGMDEESDIEEVIA